MGRALYASCHEALRAVPVRAVRLALRGPGLASVRVRSLTLFDIAARGLTCKGEPWLQRVAE